MEAFLAVIQSGWFVQGVGFIGLAISIAVFQFKDYNKLVKLRILSEFIFGLQFLLLGAYTGMATNFAACVTNSVYRYCNQHGKSTKIFQILFGALFVGIGILTWQGPISLLVITAKILSTVALGNKNTRVIRSLNLIVTPLWLIYDIIAFTIGGVLSDLLTLTSLLVSVVRFDILGRKKENA